MSTSGQSSHAVKAQVDTPVVSAGTLTETQSAVERAIARVSAVYGGWRRSTTVADMRADWDRLFWSDAMAASTEPVSAGGVAATWISTVESRTDHVLIYLHGGGYKLGSVRSHQDLMARLAQAAGVRVLGLDYRLAPEHQFPAPVEDAVAAYQWLLAQGIPAAHIAIAGDSAGGGLALSTLLLARERGLPLPAAAVLLSAWTDLSASGASYETRAASDPIHQRAMILATAKNYLGDADARHPLASPLFADLSGLPPLLLQVGDRETGLNDSLDLAERAGAVGVDVELEVWDDMIHVFQQFAPDIPEADQAIRSIGRFLQQHLSIGTQTS